MFHVLYNMQLEPDRVMLGGYPPKKINNFSHHFLPLPSLLAVLLLLHRSPRMGLTERPELVVVVRQLLQISKLFYYY